MLEVIVGSSVVAALITAVVTGFFKIIDHKREDAIRSNEREESRKDRAAEADLVERRERDAREQKRLQERKAEERAQARVLLQHLEALQAKFDAVIINAPYLTYSYNRDLMRPIASSARLIPSAAFREYVALAMQVIQELHVPAQLAEGPEYPDRLQKEILATLIVQTSRVVTDDGWDSSLVSELRSHKEAIDDHWEGYESIWTERESRK